MNSPLLVAADRREFAGILRHSKKLCIFQWSLDFACKAEFCGREVLLVANGPGPALVTRAVEVASNRSQFDLLVSVGLCGGLAPDLAASEIFVARVVQDAVGGEVFECVLPASAPPYECGCVISQDRVAVTLAEKRALRANGADVVEMEAGAVARQAVLLGMPFACVRVISDTADEDFTLDLNTMRTADGHFSQIRIVMAALTRPVRLVPELLRLQRRSKQAALALGDFLANCRF